jgi:hypothetical protein
LAGERLTGEWLARRCVVPRCREPERALDRTPEAADSHTAAASQHSAVVTVAALKSSRSLRSGDQPIGPQQAERVQHHTGAEQPPTTVGA